MVLFGPTNLTMLQMQKVIMKEPGQEIWDQTEGKIDGFVCSSGTGGTISGVSNALKEKNKDIKIYLSDRKVLLFIII